MIEPFKMEEDPDGTSQQVAVIMTGKVYREAGLKQSKHPEVEGMLYDKLCQIGKHKLRDDVRRMALSIALSVSLHSVVIHFLTVIERLHQLK